jgi:hypothetical protein
MKSKVNEHPVGSVKVTTFEVPPLGFDPRGATKARLAHHGIAPKPDKDKQPELFEKWMNVYSKKLIHIVPEFVRNENKKHRPAANRSREKDGSQRSFNWTGVVARPPVGDRFKWITASWIVPNPSQPHGLAKGKRYYSSAWIGIDGWLPGDLLQAGTESDILMQDNAAHRTVSHWWEWYPDGSVTINNHPVAPGDYVACLICSTGQTAMIYFANLSAHTHTSFQIRIPRGSTFKGNSADWVVEAPLINGAQSELADYGATFFDGSYAGTQKEVRVDSGSGFTVKMMNGAKDVVSEGTIRGSDLLKAHYR